MNDKFLLTLEDNKEIYEIIKCRNINEHSLNIFKTVLKTWDIRKLCRDVCSKVSLDYCIDFVNGTIQKCACSHSYASSIKLSEDNFSKLYTKELIFEKSVICKECFHYINVINKSLGRKII